MNFRFDTRDTKPRIYGLGIIAAAASAVVLVLAYAGGRQNTQLMVFFAAASCLLLSAGLIVVFVKQIHYNPYSYNTIYYFGFSLFFFSVFLTLGSLSLQIVNGSSVDTITEISRIIVNSAKTYMLYTAPFIVVFSAALCFSNIVLIHQEGLRFFNVLGILLSFALIGGELFLYRFEAHIPGTRTEILIHALSGNLFAAVYLYCECMLIGTIVANVIAAAYEPLKDKDFMIILGCGLKADGTPTKLLQGRIDRALQFNRMQEEETGRELIFIPSGGQGPDEKISESESIKRYLMEHGIPESRILKEDQSTTTFENMAFSKKIIEAVNPKGKTVFSTTNYHIFRSGIWARRNKIRAVGIGSDTKWYFWPNAAVREFAGLLAEHRGKQALILGGLILFYTMLTLLSFGMF